MKNKNILELCLSPDLGGLELFMVSCIENFQKKTNCYAMVAPNKKLDTFLSQKVYLKRNKFFPIIPALKLAKFIDMHEIDIVHFHWTRDIATVVLAKVLSKRKIKLVQSRHMTMTRFKDDFYHKWLYKNIDMIHAVTDQVEEQLKKFIPKDIRPQLKTVHLGTKTPSIDSSRVEVLREKYSLEDAFLVGIIGRIEEAKGQFLVLEAIAKLKELNVKALIVGQAMEENYLEQLKAKVSSLEIEDRVIFTGFSKEVHEHIKLCDVTVLATPKETFGLVVIESMANGIPVIAVNNGGPLEIIEEGVDGLFFDRSVEDLEKKIKLFYHDKSLREKIAEQALRSVEEKFNDKKQLNKLYEVIHEG